MSGENACAVGDEHIRIYPFAVIPVRTETIKDMKSKFFIPTALFLASISLPATSVFAQTVTTVPALLTRLEEILNVIIPFIIGLAVFTIIWGIFIYITKAGEEEKRSEAKLYIVWGIIAVFSMLSIWGFVNILVNSFGIPINPPISYPQAPTL